MSDRAIALSSAALVLGLGSALGWTLGAPPVAILVMFLCGVAGVGAVVLTTFPVQQVPAPVQPGIRPYAVSPLHTHPDFATLLDSFPFPLVLVAQELVIASNKAAKGLLGEFIDGLDVRSAIRHPAAVDRLTRYQQRAGAGPVQLVGLGAPTQRWELRVAELTNGALLVTLLDQSDRDAVDRMRADFVANASHELRTPLAAILGYVETLQDDSAGADAAVRQRFLSVIDTQARHMRQLIDELLSISRLEAERHILPQEEANLAELAHAAAQEARTMAPDRAKDLVLDLALAAQDAAVRGDKAQLAQLLRNILNNAFKYGRPGTPVTMALRKTQSNMLEISITDVGDGIAPEHLPRLTERFYRIDAGRSRELGGTGLGLAIVRHITERHRGQLEIQSRPGDGTVVTVRLPALETQSAPARPADRHETVTKPTQSE